MSNPNDTPAFPIPAGADVPGYRGMSLRDWFAGQALVGILAKRWPDEGLNWEALNLGKDADVAWLAVNSYRLAEAMLKARES